mmetsp:Transcript_18349/g.32477  ORF Transcript_18349/g.32477 Transcript_18349/m.32477 type:complete len:344 (+) Transcript_18349:1576-2607(+)
MKRRVAQILVTLGFTASNSSNKDPTRFQVRATGRLNMVYLLNNSEANSVSTTHLCNMDQQRFRHSELPDLRTSHHRCSGTSLSTHNNNLNVFNSSSSSSISSMHRQSSKLQEQEMVARRVDVPGSKELRTLLITRGSWQRRQLRMCAKLPLSWTSTNSTIRLYTLSNHREPCDRGEISTSERKSANVVQRMEIERHRLLSIALQVRYRKTATRPEALTRKRNAKNWRKRHRPGAFSKTFIRIFAPKKSVALKKHLFMQKNAWFLKRSRKRSTGEFFLRWLTSQSARIVSTKHGSSINRSRIRNRLRTRAGWSFPRWKRNVGGCSNVERSCIRGSNTVTLLNNS